MERTRVYRVDDDAFSAWGLTRDDALELEGVMASLNAYPQLRSRLADPSYEEKAKLDLVSTLWGTRISQASCKALAHIAQSAENSAHLIALIHDAIVRTLLMTSEDLSTTGDELFSVCQLITSDSELHAAIQARSRSVEQRYELIASLIRGKVTQTTCECVRIAFASPYRDLASALEEYARYASELSGNQFVVATVAKMPTDTQRERLMTRLSSSLGGSVHVHYIVDPQVLGGMKLTWSQQMIDATVRAMTDDLHQRIGE